MRQRLKLARGLKAAEIHGQQAHRLDDVGNFLDGLLLASHVDDGEALTGAATCAGRKLVRREVVEGFDDIDAVRHEALQLLGVGHCGAGVAFGEGVVCDVDERRARGEGGADMSDAGGVRGLWEGNEDDCGAGDGGCEGHFLAGGVARADGDLVGVGCAEARCEGAAVEAVA